MPRGPEAFLCYASEDKPLARQLASDLQAAGIKTFFAEWEIIAGESIRRKIDEGLESCTHFIALLTPNSIEKPWVNVEMDAAFVRKVQGFCRLIALRHDLPVEKLPPLLNGFYSPPLDNYEEDLSSLISDICGFSRKPPLGKLPSLSQSSIQKNFSLSPAAAKIIELIVRRSDIGRYADPQLSGEDLKAETNLSDTDLLEAVHDLEDLGYAKPLWALGCGPLGFQMLLSTDQVFVQFDAELMSWNPREDALRIAADLVNKNESGVSVSKLADKYEWKPRRINPAVNYLVSYNLVTASAELHPVFARTYLSKNSATRRFVRDNI